MVAFTHQDLLDDTPAGVLHSFAFGVERHGALGWHTLLERRECGPQQKAAKPKH